MARFHGAVGFGSSTETSENSGVWEDVIIELPYRGDIVKNTRRLQGTDGVNDNITVGNSISIVADSYAIEHFLDIKYVRWNGNLWIVSTVTVQRPRLLLDLGSVYNGPTP
jgi:hypothetical protein